MKIAHYATILVAALATQINSTAQAEVKHSYDMCCDMTLFPAEANDYNAKIHCDEKLGLQWYMEAAYGYWNATGTETDTPRPQNMFLLHGQVAKRILSSSEHSGLWVRAEVAVSLGLDAPTRRTDNDFSTAVGGFTAAHAEYMGGREIVMPEIVLTQFFKNDRAVLNFGVVNLTNYFDAVGIANDAYGSFTNSGFLNSTVLPLNDSNLGAVFTFQIDEESWAIAGVARTNTEPGYNPFKSGRGAVYVLEYGRTFADGKGTFRINPFLNAIEGENAAGDAKMVYNYGLAGSVEYSFGDRVDVYARAGFSARDEYGTDNDFSVGTHIRPFSSEARESDFIGIAAGIFKPGFGGEAETTRQEKVIELMYNFQVNHNILIKPHFQYIMDPASNTATDDAIVWGVQAVFYF